MIHTSSTDGNDAQSLKRTARKVYPVGYGTAGAFQYVEQLMTQTHTLLIDTRRKPSSWNPQWRQASLQEKYGKRYRWAGAYLGNLNFQGGPITIADPDEGIRGLRLYLEEGFDLILLCQCPEYHACHRKMIVDLLLQQVSVEVVHRSDDPWFVGTYGFVLENARALEPIPYRGQLKLFPVPASLIASQDL